jgi:hypothetical protein
VYGHIIQSKQPIPLSWPNENSKVPVPATLIIIHVGFNSPESKQPELPEPGFIDGFETVPV